MLQFTNARTAKSFSYEINSPILILESQKLGNRKIIELVEKLGKRGKIKILRLGDNNITDEAIPSIVEHLLLNSSVNLEKLDLGLNQITEAGARTLLNALIQKNTLNELFLRGNLQISTELLSTLETLIKNNQVAQTISSGSSSPK